MYMYKYVHACTPKYIYTYLFIGFLCLGPGDESGPHRGSHIPTLGSMYVLKQSLDPLGSSFYSAMYQA